MIAARSIISSSRIADEELEVGDTDGSARALNWLVHRL